jgi:hypothetical protein
MTAPMSECRQDYTVIACLVNSLSVIWSRLFNFLSVAQMAAHLIWIQGVAGSNPATQTNL